MDTPVEHQGRDAVVLARVRPFRLGAVEIRPATREIVGPRGREVAEPRVMQVLVALARAQAEVVTRDDLIASCWGGRIVGEDAITRVISRLRRHSEGVGRDGWTLETVTKVGYRLAPLDHDPHLAVTAPRRANRRGLVLAGAGVAVAAVAGTLAWRLRPEPVSTQARALYEKGQEALRQGLPDPTAQAVGFLRAAVAEEPEYADAWGALSRAYQASITFTEPARQEGVAAQAQAAAKRALELDPWQRDAATTLALLTPVYRNWPVAEPLFLRAMALHPKEPALELAYCRLTLGLGRIREALAAAQAAVAGDPYAPYSRNALAITLWAAGRTEEAELVLQKALALWPRHRALWFPYFNLLAHTGRPGEALAFAADLDGRPAAIPAADFEQNLKSARAMQSRAPRDVEAAATANVAAAKLGVGFAEIALHWLSGLDRLDDAFAVARGLYLGEGFQVGGRRYSADQGRFELGEGRNSHFLFIQPTAPMRADPRFAALVRDIGIAAYWRASGRGPDDPDLPRS